MILSKIEIFWPLTKFHKKYFQISICLIKPSNIGKIRNWKMLNKSYFSVCEIKAHLEKRLKLILWKVRNRLKLSKSLFPTSFKRFPLMLQLICKAQILFNLVILIILFLFLSHIFYKESIKTLSQEHFKIKSI